MVFSVETNNSNQFLRVYESGCDCSCGYYSQNRWVDNDRLVISRSCNSENSETPNGVDLVLIDLTDNSEKLLLENKVSSFSNFIVYGTKVYYVEGKFLLCSLDVDTLEIKEIYKSIDEPIAFPHITKDGRYINWFFEGSERPYSTCYRIDLETREVIKMVEKGFLPPFKTANHFMINPTNPDIVFFSHEGDTRYISNRLWLAPLGEEPYNIAPQRLDKNGNLIDCFGHESWAADGKGLYFVKYLCSPQPPQGIGYVDIETRQSKMMFTKNYYWHVCAAPNGKYLAADLQPVDEAGVESGVCLIDIDKNTEEILVKVRNNKKHPGHPHPQFNPSCTRICFHDIIDEDTVTVGIINI